ncbi:MAG TPA: SpoIIE family protein phosphatase [Anaerolineaceae bacterium]|jgi:serine phosphatase RsbU (regulator of sigma subunit)|nr:SpoIIE family protein phosphatase [Anaerolineaceae bacterium]NMD27768.1 SpoIIE family protein phosphatase [Chloroflexota bacterium]HOA21426.1 SpoIIE family protein phosphatase [Anaerolineaceae bacterium]HOG76954.1 SpoIIE family protein phosphatase [Anaerolineaceae bacterium]
MEIQIAIAKVDRFSSPEQGDQVEIVERPNGGVSVILGEGKLNGNRSRFVARKAVHRVLSLLLEGIHDGAASRAVLSALKTEYHNEAELSLSILSCDLESETLVLTKNNDLPVIMIRKSEGSYTSYEGRDEVNPLQPNVYQFPIENNFIIIMFSDGVATAGWDCSQPLEWSSLMESVLDEQELTVHEIADQVLNQAIAQDLGQPHDDMAVVVVQVGRKTGKPIRRMSLTLPL